MWNTKVRELEVTSFRVFEDISYGRCTVFLNEGKLKKSLQAKNNSDPAKKVGVQSFLLGTEAIQPRTSATGRHDLESDYGIASFPQSFRIVTNRVPYNCDLFRLFFV